MGGLFGAQRGAEPPPPPAIPQIDQAAVDRAEQDARRRKRGKFATIFGGSNPSAPTGAKSLFGGGP